MSEDRLSKTRLVSNESVIEELTSKIETSSFEDGNHDIPVINPCSSHGDNAAGSTNANTTEQKPNTTRVPSQPDYDNFGEDDDDEENPKKKGEDSDTDSLNEETLKNAEVELTEDQLEERRIIAEELKGIGNEAFKEGDFDRSIDKYSEGLRLCPLKYPQQRSVLYCNRSAAKMKQKKYKSAITDCSKAIALDDKYLKAYLRRAQSSENTEKLDEALADYNKVLELDPLHSEAKKATLRLPPLIEAKNEKLKTEMLGKLKDLGNMILKPFGLSTENFQLEQDAESEDDDEDTTSSSESESD